jgi:hypothetical protein
MASFLDCCRFIPTAGGTTDWTYASAVGGYQSPAAAGAVNGATYRYRAESADLTQWEIGYGGYNSSTAVLSRSAVLFNSVGSTAKISFATVPQVAIVALAEDLNGFALHTRTRTVLTSGSGTYTVPAGCTAINVRLVGGGGGGGGGGTGSGGGSGGNTTTFGSGLLIAGGGGPGGPSGGGGATGGAASGGDINLTGSDGQASYGAGGASSVVQGSMGGAGPFGGSGYGGWPGANGAAAPSNSGGGGGGGGGSAAGSVGAGGGAGGYCEKLISNPAASYPYVVAASVPGGSPGSGGQAGGAGASGLIIIDEYY